MIDSFCDGLVFKKYLEQGKKLAPKPKGIGLGGNLKESTQDRLNFLLNMQSKFGDVVRLRFFDAPAHLICHPDDIKRVFVTNYQNYQKNDPGYKRIKNLLGNGLLSSEGAPWKKGRKLLQPLFAHKSSREHIPEMQEIIGQHYQNWKAKFQNGETFDLAEEAVDISLDMSCQIIFGGASVEFLDSVKVDYKIAQEQMVTQLQSAIGIFTPGWVPTEVNRKFNSAKERLLETSRKIIEIRRQKPGHDFISKLIQAKDETSGEQFSEQDIIDQVLTFLFSAHETTANYMAWSWYLLAKHPDIQAKVREELRQNITGEIPTEEELDRCKLFNQCLLEGNRLYPPIWVIMRQAIEDDTLGGYFIPKGSLIFISPYLTHRHRDFFEDPESYRPERFSDEFLDKVNNHAYFPFGLGPRNCIGKIFSSHEVRFTLSRFFRDFEVKLHPQNQTEMNPQVLLFPKNGILVQSAT